MSYTQIAPKYYWVCPEDNKKFEDPQYKCRYCENFVRFHTDNISGLDLVIGCKFHKDPHQTILKDGGKTRMCDYDIIAIAFLLFCVFVGYLTKYALDLSRKEEP